jgi:ubiquinol-cytochrome c reductase cytochrome c subunit
MSKYALAMSTVLFISLALSRAVAQDASVPQASATAGDAKLGRVTFQRFGCYQCHGTSGEGAGQFGPKIAPDPLPLDAFTQQLRAPRSQMPIYTARVLSEKDLVDIYAYLQAMPPAKKVADIPLLNPLK